jgi:hypothetical protein
MCLTGSKASTKVSAKAMIQNLFRLILSLLCLSMVPLLGVVAPPGQPEAKAVGLKEQSILKDAQL